MIIKTISRKSNVSQLIRYVLADIKLTGVVKDKPSRPYSYVPKFLTKEDLRYLHAEREDKELLRLFKECGNNITAFMDRLSGKQPEAGSLKPLVITQNLRSKSVEGICREYEVNEKMRLHARSNAVQAYHSILSFSKLDRQHITREMLEDMTRMYIELRGSNNLFVATVHQDRQHYHIHIVQSGIQYLTGKSNRVSRQEFQDLKVAMQEYQKDKYPELIHSLPEHVKSRERAIEKEAKKNIKFAERTSDKNSLLQLLQTVYDKSHSLEQFLTAVNEQGHEVYYRDGRLQGIKYDGDRKFRFSGLGYTKEKFEAFDTKKEKEQQTLDDLKDIRDEFSTELEYKDSERDHEKDSEEDTDTENDSVEESNQDKSIV